MIKYKKGEDLILSYTHGTKESGVWFYPDGTYSFYSRVSAGYGEAVCNARSKARHLAISRDSLSEITMAHQGGDNVIAFIAKSRTIRRLK